MEAVPRLPMMSFHLKVSPEPTKFGPKLKQYIADFYNEHAESYSHEIHHLESLRAMAVRPPMDMVGCSVLKKYYCQLHFLQSRFPMGKDGAAAVIFTWKDTYANLICQFANIRFEIISILYNIGAMHTRLGALTKRTSVDGMKMACAHFQCAAWAFEHLKTNYPQPSGADLSSELMTFKHYLCLAQAQECILEKSMLDNRKPTIVAKVAKQIVDYITQALNTLEQGGSEDGPISDRVGTKIYKGWKYYLKFKKAYHSAVTYLYQGLAAEEQRKMGERVAFYNAALASLNEAQSIYSNIVGDKTTIGEALTFTNDVIEGKRKAAKNENEFIYHEEVPEKETLSTVKGAPLVKGISFSINDPEVSGPDIFARLVPMKVHEANSLYSEEKAKILRSVGSKIDERDQQLNTYLTSLKLEHISLWDPDDQMTEWERLPLPDELVERCAALNAKPQIIQDLVDIMEKLSEASQDVEKILKEIKKLLVDEDQREKEYQDAVGKRPPSIVATDLTREAKKYEEAHEKATESNCALGKAITTHVKNLKILSQPLAELIKHIPSPSAYLSEQNTEKSHTAIELERMHTKELKNILNKVDEMRRQRNDLHAKLRDSVAQDDLTRLLVTATSDSGPLDHLFAEQLAKHDSLVKLIEQNLTAQDRILSALTDAYAQTANIRKGVEEILKRREHMISSLIASYDACEDLLGKSSKGLEFYRKLEINVSKLLQRLKSTCKVQEEEREQILAQDNNKNIQERNESPSNTYDQTRHRTGSGQKLKDYLNNRPENVQGQYYNMYKGQGKQTMIDAASKPNLNDAEIKTGAIASGSSTLDTVLSTKFMQQYYPASYTDYKTNLPYSHETSMYNQDPSQGQSYVQVNSSDAASTYQQASGPNTVTDTTAQYPGTSFMPNGQFPATQISQPKYAVPTQSQYNFPSNMLSYEAYQNPVDYSSYNVAQQYPSTFDKSASGGNVEVQDVNSQMLPISQTSVPSSNTINSATDMKTFYYSTVAQQGQEYATDLQSKQLSQEMVPIVRNQDAMPTNSTQIQGYAYSQVNEASSNQNYSNMVYYNPLELHSQQITSTQTVPVTPDVTVTTPYMQTQYMNVNIPPSVHSTTSMSPSVNNIGVSYGVENAHGVNVQYQQQGGTDQSRQSIDKDYQPQLSGNEIASGYPNTYQSVQHGVSAVSYPQTILSADTSNTYTYTNCSVNSEMIQSHTKSSTNMQNYSQTYQCQQQLPYGGYGNYSHSYNQGYGYVQGTQISSTIADPYKSQMSYIHNPPNECYKYNSANGVQTSQNPNATKEASDSIPQINTGINSTQQQQESGARYTNASNNSMVSQTPSSQYATQTYQPQSTSDIYYTTPYGLQMQNQTLASKSENSTNYNQTYMQAVNSGTNTTTSGNLTKSTTSSEQSNVDLLADLDVTINHAPLVPEIRPLNKVQQPLDETPGNSVEQEEVQDSKKNESAPTNTQDIVSTDEKIENETLQIVWDTWYNDVQPKKDPLGDPVALQKFISEVEKYEKFVDSLLVKTLSGATNLDIKWKEVQEFEEKENGKQSCTVALAHSSENRVVECIPYDTTRAQISSTDISNYINASHVTEITQWIPTAFIITQAPLPDKLEVFWTMIWEQESEIIACLLSDTQLNGNVYWPTNEKDTLNVGNFAISLKKKVNHAAYIQRVISVHNQKKSLEKTVIHMQFLAWPSNGFPSSPGSLLAFSTDVMTEQALRRCTKPVVVHCLDGGSLSSLFLVAAATVCHIRADCGIANVPLVYKGILKCRKQVVNKESLLFAYQLVLYHAQDILMKRGILSSTRSTFENFEGLKGNKDKASRKMHPSDDFLQTLGRKKSSSSGITHSVNSSIQEKPKEGSTIDPLSQLDPLWSIRR